MATKKVPTKTARKAPAKKRAAKKPISPSDMLFDFERQAGRDVKGANFKLTIVGFVDGETLEACSAAIDHAINDADLRARGIEIYTRKETMGRGFRFESDAKGDA